MNIQDLYPDGRLVVKMSGGQLFILSPTKQADTRALSNSDGLQTGWIQKIHFSLDSVGVYIAYLVTEESDHSLPKIHLEYLTDPDDILVANNLEEFFSMIQCYDQLTTEEITVFLALYRLEPTESALKSLLSDFDFLPPPERKNKLAVLKKVVELTNQDRLRQLPENRRFWTDTGLPILSQLGITL